ncbi:MAG TPA: DUF6786 family protein [Parafilimonas sp.]|nr:DUF6786 family protein [Parafilimonas sp.]
MIRLLAFYFLLFSLIACNNTNNKKINDSENTMYPLNEPVYEKGSYGYDAAFLKKHAGNVIELENGDAKILLSADYQGRVFTSTAAGDSGASFGWINYKLLEDPVKKTQFNPVGGEERFWLGPEGGQYSIYFKKNDPFDFAHWQVPALIDTVAYKVDQSDKTSATFSVSSSITNYTGTTFDLAITRSIHLLDKNAIGEKLSTSIPDDIKTVAYETNNQIKNTGNNAWKKDSGLLSVWLLGMFTPTEETKVIIPFSLQKKARDFITDDYFGKIDSSRLIVKDSVLYFRCDGKSRGKLGLKPVIAKPMACSYDFKKDVLTILIPEVHKDGMYVNSKWELQKQPFSGDVINSYNDGPLQDGSQMGPFYEIESSSPAKELKPGEMQEYHQTTIHLQGAYSSLKTLVQQLIHVDLDDVKNW